MKRSDNNFLIIILFLYFFKYVLSVYIPLGEYIYLLPMMIYVLLNILRRYFNKITLYLLFFNFSFISIYIISLFRDVDLIIASTALLNYTLTLNFWVLYLNNNILNFNKKNKKLYFFIFFISLGAIVQYYIDPKIFGLINDSIYSDEDNLRKSVFSKRAISIIKSPQTLGFVLAIFILYSKNKVLMVINYIAAILTFTKVFFLSIFLDYLLRFKIKYIGVFIFLLVTSSWLVYKFQEFSGVSRLYYFIFEFQLKSQADRLDRWAYYFNMYDSLDEFVFGNGLGIASRANEILGANSLEYSSESFLIQIFTEAGLFGLLLFIIPFIFLFLNDKNQRVKIFILFILLMLSPAFYGFSVSFLIYPLILIPFFLNFKKESFLEQ